MNAHLKRIDNNMRAYLETIDLSKHTRKLMTPEDLWNLALDYFEYKEKDTTPIQQVSAGKVVSMDVVKPMSLLDFCIYAGITEQAFRQYRYGKHLSAECDSRRVTPPDDSTYEDYVVVSTCIKEIIENEMLTGVMLGKYNHSIVAQILGMKAKLELSGDKENPVQVQQVTGMVIK